MLSLNDDLPQVCPEDSRKAVEKPADAIDAHRDVDIIHRKGPRLLKLQSKQIRISVTLNTSFGVI